MHILILIVAAFLAGALNAVAGGGSFLTFPALVFVGIPAVIANATSTVALLPGSFASAFSYRHGVASLEGISLRTHGDCESAGRRGGCGASAEDAREYFCRDHAVAAAVCHV